MADDYEILVTLSTFAEYSKAPLKRLQESKLSFKINSSGKRMTPEEILSQGRFCRGVIAGVEPYRSDLLEQMPNLRCISRVGVGTDNIDLDACRKRGVMVLNTPEEPVLAVAELTMAMILGLMRQLPRVNFLTRAGKWQRVPGNLLHGKTLGLIGLGRIGKKVAQLMQPFKTRIIATDPFPDIEWADKFNVSLTDLDTLLKAADIISIHASVGGCDLKLGRRELSMMKPGGWLINMARGDMVDDIALYEALKSGQLSGAGLDVFPHEPYTGPLLECDGVIVTPHQATLNYETRVDMEIHAVENIIEFFQG